MLFAYKVSAFFFFCKTFSHEGRVWDVCGRHSRPVLSLGHRGCLYSVLYYAIELELQFSEAHFKFDSCTVNIVLILKFQQCHYVVNCANSSDYFHRLLIISAMSKSIAPVFRIGDSVRFRCGPNSGQRLKVIKMAKKVRVRLRISNILLVFCVLAEPHGRIVHLRL